MKNIGKISATSAILFLLFFSSFGFVQAQTNTDYTVLAPLPGITTANCGGDTPTGELGCTTNLQTYLPAAFNLVIGLCAVLAFLVLTYGGVLYMTSDAISGKSQGKTYIENALWGLGLAIASWVILYTINPAILHFNLQLAQPNTNPQSADILAAIAASQAAGTPTAGQTMTQAQIQANALIAQQLGQTPNPCTQGQTTGCVNLVGLQQDTVTGLQDLKTICQNNSGGSCPINITGGTEGGHTAGGSHDNGTAVDVSANDALANTIKNTFTKTSQNADGSCPIYTDGNGDTYLYEVAGNKCGGTVASTGAPHFHITFK